MPASMPKLNTTISSAAIIKQNMRLNTQEKYKVKIRWLVTCRRMAAARWSGGSCSIAFCTNSGARLMLFFTMVSNPIFLSTVKKKALAAIETSSHGSHQLDLRFTSSKVLVGATNTYTTRCNSESPEGAGSIDSGATLLIRSPLNEFLDGSRRL